MRLKGKRVILTGASGGIGQAFANALAGEGAELVLVARNTGVLQTLCERLPGQGHSLIAADLALAEGREAVASGAGSRVDLLINNAGANVFSLLEDQAEAELRRVLELNLVVPMLLTRALLPHLTAGRGTVVNVGSTFGSIGFAGFSAYSASKFGLRGFSEALRRELADTGVDVLYLAPRATVTDMNSREVEDMNAELGTAMDTPATVAAELLALLHKPRGVRFVGWPEKFFVRLNGLLPAVVDKSLLAQLPVVRRYALAAARSRE